MEENRKRYRTIDEQIDYLVENKNIDRATIDRELLAEVSYMSLVTPYTVLICKGRDSRNNNRHVYDQNIDFKYYINWHNIDNYISAKLQIAIGNFEKKLKSFLSDEISRMMYEFGDVSCCTYDIFLNYLNGEDVLEFLNINSDYDRDGKIILVESSSRKKAINTLLETATNKKTSNKKTSNSLMKHYSRKDYIPFWIIVRTLTINELIQFFSMLPMQSRIKFIENYIGGKVLHARDVFKLTSKLNDIRILRNIVNHYEPIIPFILNYEDSKKDILLQTLDFLISKNKRIKLQADSHMTILTPINEYNKNNIGRMKRVLEIIEK